MCKWDTWTRVCKRIYKNNKHTEGQIRVHAQWKDYINYQTTKVTHQGFIYKRGFNPHWIGNALPIYYGSTSIMEDREGMVLICNL